MNDNLYMNIGIDFLDANGIRTTSIQLVNKNRGSIADAHFEDEKLIKCVHLSEVDRTKFLDEAKNLLENSIPQSYTHLRIP